MKVQETSGTTDTLQTQKLQGEDLQIKTAEVPVARDSDHSGQGIILVNTGDGKGKTTAALGTVLRAAGDGLKILFLQFIKSGAGYGELKGLEKLSDNVTVRSMGKGFVFHKQNEDPEQRAIHKEAAEKAWEKVVQEVESDLWDLIVLDEINYAVDFGLLDVRRVTALLDRKPPRLHMILTGRNAKPEIIERAHTVTEMKVIKHAYEQGIKAVKGIEY